MPFFRYAANDSHGRAIQGTVQAATPDEAAAALSQKGIRVTAWLDPAAKNAIPAAYQPKAPGVGHQAPGIGASAASVPVPVAQSPAPQRQIVLERPSVPVLNQPQTTSRKLEPKRTPRGKDKERFFLFTQIASFLRAGVNPHQAFADMASRMRNEHYREAMMKVAQYASEGIAISEVLAAYPDLFPGHVVGMVRAGEVGGFLPEACTAVAQQAEASHKFRRSLWMVWVVIIHAFLAIPVGYLAYRLFPRAYEITESSGATDFGGGLNAVNSAFWELIKWPIGPAVLLVDAAAILLYLWINSRPMTPRRHGWSLRTPILGGRAKNEGLSLFAWVLSKVAQAGSPPYRSWELGVESVPNIALQEKLRAVGGKLHSGERLSTAFYDSHLFPDEYAPMVATGEMTGDVPGMLQKLSEMSRQEFEISTTKSKAAAWVMSTSALIATAGILLIFVILMWYVRMPQTVLKDLEVP